MENQELITILADLKSDVKVVSNSVAAIEKHLERQNGRIGKAEAAIAQALEERAANRQKQEDYFTKIDALDSRLDLVEKAEVQHIVNCPMQPKVRTIEDKLLSQQSVKKFMFVMFTSGVALGGLVVGILKLFLG